MGLYMEKNGYYYIKVSQNGQITKLTTKTKNKSLAQEIYNNFLLSLVNQRSIARITTSKRNVETIVKPIVKERNVEKEIKEINNDLIDAYNKYIITCSAKGHSANNLYTKNWTLQKFIKHGILTFNDLNQDNLDKLFIDNKDYANATMETLIREVKSFINNCIKRGLFSRDLYQCLDFPKIKRVGRQTVIAEDDFKRIIDFIESKGNYDFSFYITTLYYTVSRPNEARIIKLEDFDEKNKTVKIFMNKVKETKETYLPDIYFEMLKKHLERTGITSGFLFIGGTKGDEFYSKQFQKLKVEMNLPKDYILYAFRHTAVTDQLNSTNDIHFVSKQAGNNPEVALKHYVNRNTKHYQALVEKAFPEKE
ncbi:MAG TPA: hypothetical protein DDY71_10350 [Spirochaetia bacterium]|nr:MAG: hypothetical protein A2Y30_06135 [Spirochaetes bacterium GWE1_32_154]HBD95081.1 hypothetical protein [Spirochaetia bacterium]HBI38033.1 hypothetical protein [Spirochaetia bacterium]